jgi:hypothetical protein
MLKIQSIGRSCIHARGVRHCYDIVEYRIRMRRGNVLDRISSVSNVAVKENVIACDNSSDIQLNSIVIRM